MRHVDDICVGVVYVYKVESKWLIGMCDFLCFVFFYFERRRWVGLVEVGGGDEG